MSPPPLPGPEAKSFGPLGLPPPLLPPPAYLLWLWVYGVSNQ